MPSAADGLFAHRGLHGDASDENSRRAFRRAVAALGGFECDVRLSRQGTLVAVHDATLQRTHGVAARVADLSDAVLRALGVATLDDALACCTGDARVVVDVKASPGRVVPRVLELARTHRIAASRLLLVVWEDAARLPPTEAVRLCGRELVFAPPDPNRWDGVACKYDGSAANRRCIRAVLERGLHVNLFAVAEADAARMVDEWGGCAACTFTV